MLFVRALSALSLWVSLSVSLCLSLSLCVCIVHRLHHRRAEEGRVSAAGRGAGRLHTGRAARESGPRRALGCNPAAPARGACRSVSPVCLSEALAHG
jgi:hypothetical protein